MSKADREGSIAMIVENRRLVPADAWAQDELEKLPNGARFNVYVTLAVSDPDDAHGRLLAKYMAGMNELFDYLPNTGAGTQYPTMRKLRKTILEDLGFCTTHPRVDGSVKKEAVSMARDSMPYDELQVCFELTRAYALVLTERITGQRFDPWERYEREHPRPTP